MKQYKITLVVQSKDPQSTPALTGEMLLRLLEDHGIDPLSLAVQPYAKGMVGAVEWIKKG